MKFRRLHRWIATGLLLALSSTLPALAERPKIGLALSGGDAKGSAHIGVLEILEANQVPVDYIAGTSIGSYVGGLYALGYSAAEIKQIMLNARLEEGFSDAIDRDKLPYRMKRQHDKFNAGIEAGFKDGELRIPWGVLYGQSMAAAYRRSAGNIPSFDSFDELAIPFRAIATNLGDHSTAVLDRGDLLRAMKASAAVPGALVPVKIDDQLLVDGGMAENLPVSQVRKMGADIIIAVDISSPLQSTDEINNVLSVLDQLSNFLTVQNLAEQKKKLGPIDIYIRPGVDGISTTDFSSMDLAYSAGKLAAEQSVDSIRELSAEDEVYEQYQRRKKVFHAELKRRGNLPIVQIILDNRSSYNDHFLLETLGLETGKPISTAQILKAVDRVYSLDVFERVDAAFEDREQGRVLIVEVVEKSWGPNYLEFGIGWEDDFTLDSIINIDFAFTIGNITDNNGEWRNEFSIGTDKNYRSELYLPIDQVQRFYQTHVFEFDREALDLFVDNNRAFSLEQTSYRLDLGLGHKLARNVIVEAGVILEQGEFVNELFLDETLDYKSPGVFLRFGFDSLDRISFPTRGNRLTLDLIHRHEDLSGQPSLDDPRPEDEYTSTQYLLEWRGATSHGNHGFVGKGSLALLDSEIDQSVHYVQLGGFLNLSGFSNNSLVGNQKALALAAYQYDLGAGVFGLTGIPIYAGASVETGNVWDTRDSVSADDLIWAGSLYFGTDTRLGPVALAYGFNDENEDSFYFYLGKNF